MYTCLTEWWKWSLSISPLLWGRDCRDAGEGRVRLIDRRMYGYHLKNHSVIFFLLIIIFVCLVQSVLPIIDSSLWEDITPSLIVCKDHIILGQVPDCNMVSKLFMCTSRALSPKKTHQTHCLHIRCSLCTYTIFALSFLPTPEIDVAMYMNQ